MTNNKALVVHSGGQDSTTCLGWALDMFDKVEAVTFVYGQRHDIELVCARSVCQTVGVKQHVVDMRHFFPAIVESALLERDSDIREVHRANSDLPASFVPNRNAMFLTAAHALAQKIGADHLITGVCQTDYSGYPDCRAEFIAALTNTLNLGAGTNIAIHAPLMYLTKAETFAMADEIGFLETVVETSHTCYEGDRSVRHQWGYGCGSCPACELRRKGWEEFWETMKIKE